MATAAPAVTDPNEALILSSIDQSKASPAAATGTDPNEALILGSIANPGTKTGAARSPQDAVLTGTPGHPDDAMPGLQKLRAGIGLWFNDIGHALKGPIYRSADGTTDKGPDGSILSKGTPIAVPRPAANPELDASLASDPQGGLGHDLSATIPSLAGGVGGAEASAPAAARFLRPGAEGVEAFLRWLAGAGTRGAGAGAGAGAAAPADSLGDRAKNTLTGAAGGAIAGPIAEGGINGLASIPGAIDAARKFVGRLKPAEIERLVGDYLSELATQTPAEAQAAAASAPTIPGFKPTTAAAVNDPALYNTQAGVRAKNPELFTQQVQDSDTAIRAALEKAAPNASQTQVSTAAVDRLRALADTEQAGVRSAYAPFDAVKSKVFIPTETVLGPADKVYSSLSTAERDMLPHDVLKRMYAWGEHVPFKEVEGEMTALSNAASAAEPAGARIIRNFRRAIDQGLDKVETIHDATGEEIGNFSSLNEGSQGQAPLQAYRAGRQAHAEFRQRFPTPGGDNGPDENALAKILSGDTLPSKAMQQALATPESTAAYLKAAGDDPRTHELMLNYSVNKLMSSSRGPAGQLSGDKLIRNIAQNRSIYQQFMSPAQLSALDTMSRAARMNNAALRRIMPGESGTAALGHQADNMADFVAQATLAGVEHAVPGGGMAMKLLSQLKSGTTQKQFDDLLTRALLDPPTYIRLRNLPVNANTVGIVRKQLLGRGVPTAIALGTSAVDQYEQKRRAATPSP